LGNEKEGLKMNKKPIIVYSYYVMDILHKGHLFLMENAKRIAGNDGLSIIGVLTDTACMEKKPRPILDFDTRFRIAKAIIFADIVVPQETYSPINNIKNFKPTILIESATHDEEYIKNIIDITSNMGIIVITFPYFDIFKSSTKIKQKIRERK
jgi:cytidyltransferase-like protein